jgi:oligopeptidase B
MRYLFMAALIFSFSACKNKDAENRAALMPPVPAKILYTFNEHGSTRADFYKWLDNPNDSNVIKHLHAENAYVEAYMKPTEKLQKKIYDELVERIEQKYESLPVQDNGYWYYIRFEEGKQYPIHCRRKTDLSAPEEIMLDVNELAKGHQIFLIRGRAISRDNNWVAFGSDTTGGRKAYIRFLNLSTRQYAPETISNTAGSYAWANDNKTFYYTLNDHTVRSYKVMKHVLGTDPKEDKELYTEKDSTYSVYFSRGRDNKYIFINSSSTTTTESRYMDAHNPDAAPVLIQARLRDVLYYPSYNEGNVFHIYTNRHSRNFKLSATPIAAPGISNWKDVIAHRDAALLEGVEVFKNFMVAQYKEKGLTQISVLNRSDNTEYNIDFGEDAYVANMSTPTDAYDLDSIRYNYFSLTTPGTDYSYNLSTKQKIQLKQQKVGQKFDPSKYETKRIWAKVTDGTEVPVSMVYKKELFNKDGSAPMLLYAYGSYGASSDPYFNSSVISLLDRGFVYAIAHIRGGQEMGRYWYDDGKLLKKKNTFTDFVDCAQHLVDEKYTSPGKLFANGVSAGGMLMGAITNLRPDLFRGILAEVPWMDVITDMLNSNLPLTTLEYDEWGDPNKKEYYDYMLSWSPYDNVKPANYPAILATGGLHDSQVPYFSPAKWVAKVRENNTGNNVVLFKCNMGAGHGGETGRFERQKLTALKYAFMLDQLGMSK